MSDLLRKVIPGRKAGARPASASPSTGEIPVAGLSIFYPIFLGIDENGRAVYLELPYRNLLCAGEPGGGKSVLLSNIIGHAALCPDVRLVLIDGKEVELGMWRDVADVFVGMDHRRVLTVLRDLQVQMDNRYDWLAANRRRKILGSDGIPFVLLVIDELALFSSTYGTKTDQEEFVRLVRDLVARGRAAGIIVVAATQRPSADIVPTSLRDIFGYRVAFRCTTEASSDIILGTGWAKQGYDATTIDPESRGVGWLLSEGGFPRRFKGAYLSDSDIDWLVDRAAWVRRGGEAA
jgi:S-DNA-T family DNA segregation ATPase FtsK/SpoIIIE